ncbi:YL1 nuclear protein-domain-containing protein [Suillus plorans]|uniref:YL1 nuclear protein-domain-containing protein n=1 Tax=Suillus plorans TaxID=116603 RepID=A0A9P7E2R2_9AGAM|nr:YL1 nuclear protein-domain-containing protein [Suillus plorans]KAG1809860.1 YL1 nuclear protein-domain-containing protein [Suillus plorans]
MAEEETLVLRRSKRSTAGNRMEAALAELAIEEVNEAEEDVDFVNDKDEEDVFESDFASTDDEAAAEDIDTGEKTVEDEERRARRSARARVEKATAAAHARHRVTFNPQTETSEKRPNKEAQKLKRRVSLGVAVNAETGEVIEGGTRQRQSQRSHTIMNTSATVNRMKDAEEKRATIPKKARVVTKAPTQDELIARALDTEEGNIIEHRDYLKLEEEKRARARVVRTALEGPVLRWISRKEQVKVEVTPPVPAPYPSPYGFVYNPHQGTSYSGTQNSQSPFRAYVPTLPSQVPEGLPTASQSLAATSQPQSSTPSVNTPSQPSYYYYPMQPPPAQERVVDVCKNYIVHELSQDPSAAKPPWKDTMSAMFGDEVKWDEVRVFTGKQRPLSRPVRACPITGTPAKYLDPRTNVPFANVAAFKTLTRILSHDYVWSEALGCYVAHKEQPNHDVDEGTTTKRRRVDDQNGQTNEG